MTEGEKASLRARNEEVAAFLASVRLGSLERAPRPGDVFRPARHAPAGGPRPLGLIPARGYVRDSFLPPLLLESTSVLAAQQRTDDDNDYVVRPYVGGTTFRFTERDTYSRHAPSTAAAEDREYADTLAQCKMPDYVTSEVWVPQKFDASVASPNRHRRAKTVPETGTKLLQYSHSE